MILGWRRTPILCLYYVTYRCNAKCHYCDIWRRPELRSLPDASFTDIASSLRHLKDLRVKFVDFTGGEPLLFEHLPTALSLAKTLGLYTTVTTNATLYSERACELRGLIDFLHFSLDSVAPARHNTWRGQDGYHRVFKAIERAKTLGEHPDLIFTATNESYREIAKLAVLAEGVECVLIVNPCFGDPLYSDLAAEHLRALDHYRSSPFVYVNRAFHRLRRHAGNQTTAPRCRAVSSTLVISPDNQLLLPCFHHSNQKVPIGEDLPAALASPARREALHLQGQYQFCQGCTTNCYFDPSFLYRIDSYFVESQVSKLRYAIDKYIRAQAPFPTRRARLPVNPA